MDGPIRQIRDFASHILAKEASHLLSPPPAYTRCQQPQPQPQPLSQHADEGTASTRQRQQESRQAQPPRPVFIDNSPIGELLSGSAVDDTSDMADESSPICLRINTSVRVSSNNNVLCINSTPTENAKQIADAVIKAMRDYSVGNCGLPMIDEDGRPRPVNIDVDAAMLVQGANNFVGTRETFQQYLEARNLAQVQQARALRRRRQESDEEAAEADGPAKRSRSRE